MYYSKSFADQKYVIEASSNDIQQELDELSPPGWRLVSNEATNFGMAIYFYLYFEKDA
jgi:hypothetical protein